MKRLNTIVIFLIIIQILFAQNNMNNFKLNFKKHDNYFILQLPYDVNIDCSYIFEEDTQLAIDIIEISADGKILNYIDDIRDISVQTTWKIKKTIPGQTRYFISMNWINFSNDSLRWNDGQGIIFNEVTPKLYQPKTNSYELINGMKHIKVKYRIRIPNEFILSSGVQIILKESKYSSIYTASVDLKEIWK